MKISSISKISLVSVLLLAAFFINQRTYAHCEIPCGIFDDSVRVALIKEHITTIEKSMNEINALSSEADPNYNQLIRWVINKEEHAKKIQDIVSQYFLHQRIKPVDPSDKEAYIKYQKQLEVLHHISVYAMKSKQSTDLKNIEILRAKVEEFEGMYFHTHDH